MVKCPVCKSEFPDGMKYCAFCGTELKQKTDGSEQTDIQKQKTDRRNIKLNISQKVKGKTIVIAGIAVGIFVLGAFVVGRLTNEDSENHQISDAENVSSDNQDDWITEDTNNANNLHETEDISDSMPIPDIDGAGGKTVVLYGTLQPKSYGWEVSLDSSASFLAEDIYGDTMYVKPQTSVLVETSDDLSLYEQRQVKLKGMVTAVPETSSIFITLDEIETTDGPLYDPEEGGIQRYEYVRKDCTWQEAFDECKAKGGYLVRINSEKEYQYILSEIQSRGMEDVHFFLGGRRDVGGSEYYWADQENELYGERVDSSDYWCRNEWMTGEPSLRDNTVNIEEDCLDMFYYKNVGKWVWNDVPNDILSAVPTYAGKIGYICEYEE